MKYIVDIHGEIEGDYDIIKKYDDPKTGEWTIKNGELAFWDVCSECGRMVIHKAPFYNFCPHCGADMRGDSDD